MKLKDEFFLSRISFLFPKELGLKSNIVMVKVMAGTYSLLLIITVSLIPIHTKVEIYNPSVSTSK